MIDEKMMDQVKITVIATKFDENRLRLLRLQNRSTSMLQDESEEDDLEDFIVAKKDINKEQKKVDVNSKDIEDDNSGSDLADTEFDVPTFLRRK